MEMRRSGVKAEEFAFLLTPRQQGMKCLGFVFRSEFVERVDLSSFTVRGRAASVHALHT